MLNDWMSPQSQFPTLALGAGGPPPGLQPDQASLSCPWPTGTQAGKGQGQAQVQGHILFSSVPTHCWLLPRGDCGGGLQPQHHQHPSTWVPPTERECAGLRPPRLCDFGTGTLSLCASASPPVSPSQGLVKIRGNVHGWAENRAWYTALKDWWL